MTGKKEIKIGEALRNAREQADMTQEGLALESKVDRSYLSELERDIKSPTVNKLFHLCNIIGIKLSDLIAQCEDS